MAPPLDGLKVYVSNRNDDGSDASMGTSETLAELGANVVPRLTLAKVLVWRRGERSLVEQARSKGIRVVNPEWVQRCKEAMFKLPTDEPDFAPDLSTLSTAVSAAVAGAKLPQQRARAKKAKSMEPVDAPALEPDDPLFSSTQRLLEDSDDDIIGPVKKQTRGRKSSAGRALTQKRKRNLNDGAGHSSIAKHLPHDSEPVAEEGEKGAELDAAMGSTSATGSRRRSRPRLSSATEGAGSSTSKARREKMRGVELSFEDAQASPENPSKVQELHRSAGAAVKDNQQVEKGKEHVEEQPAGKRKARSSLKRSAGRGLVSHQKRKSTEVSQDEDTNDEAAEDQDEEEKQQPQRKRAARGTSTGGSTKGSPPRQIIASPVELRVSITCMDEDDKTDLASSLRHLNKLLQADGVKLTLVTSNEATVTHCLIPSDREPRRTSKVLFALACGAWILKKDWLLKCVSEQAVVNEHEYETDVFPKRAKRQQRPLSSANKIYIGPVADPPKRVLAKLISEAGGSVASAARDATLCLAEPGLALNWHKRSKGEGATIREHYEKKRIVTVNYLFEWIASYRRPKIEKEHLVLLSSS